MVNTSSINRKKHYCEYHECSRAPAFNFEGQGGKTRFCFEHKLEGMVRLKHSKKQLCEGVGCTVQASFNYQSERKMRFCALHKLKGMENLKHGRRK
mmetsp:Transcript_27758/g.43722  ORF Transcript_27758/g.43722 Transcript_27758/m.43722 type:complete len:96 (-) Transcript_27758:75-362(-)